MPLRAAPATGIVIFARCRRETASLLLETPGQRYQRRQQSKEQSAKATTTIVADDEVPAKSGPGDGVVAAPSAWLDLSSSSGSPAVAPCVRWPKFVPGNFGKEHRRGRGATTTAVAPS